MPHPEVDATSRPQPHVVPGAGAAVEVEALYRAFAERLQRSIRRRVDAPEAVIEDACQTAWVRLILHARDVNPDSAQGWLTVTALRAALELTRRERREASLDERLEQGETAEPVHNHPGPEELCQTRARLGALARLPRRQARMLWLQAAGLSYREIAHAEPRESERTVERQLYHARRQLAC
jgi:RNA polymerase sigma factor (sigma-70 family)